MKFIDANWIYTVELSGEDIYRLNKILGYAVRSKDKAIKHYATYFREELGTRQLEEVDPYDKSS